MDYLEMAKRIAKDCGELIKSYEGTSYSISEKSSVYDIVTEVDRMAEDFIRNRISELAPDHKFLGEEESFAQKDLLDTRLMEGESEPFLWIVDPIDGTNNFVQTGSGYAVSIALSCYGKFRLGVIYDPSRDELFYAEKGKGAFLNGDPIQVSPTEEFSQCTIGLGFPSSNKLARNRVLSIVGDVAEHCRTIRSYGSAALQIAYVACGRLHGYWQPGLNIWDTAAGVAILNEAKGQVSNSEGEKFTLRTRDFLGSNQHIHNDLLGYIAQSETKITTN